MTKDSESEKMTIPPQYNAERAADIQTEYLSSLLQQMKRGGVLTEDGTLFPMISKNDRLRKTLEKMNAERSPQYIDAYNQQTNENAQTITSRVDATGNTALYDGFLIRKLTPKECWRLMGFDDSDYEKAAAVNAKSQLYKQAGNSIVVNVLEAIFKNLFFDEKDEGYRQSDIWDFL